MIIGYDGSRAFSKDRTGTENYSYQLIKNLARIDHANIYIVYLRDNPISSTIAQVIGQFPGNFHFKSINWPRLWTQAGLAIRTFTDHLDVLFIPAHTLPLIRRPTLKTVITVHDLGSEYLPSMHQVKQRIYLSFMQKYQLKTASKIIAVSEATKEDLVRRIGIEPGKIRVVYEGYDGEKYQVLRSKYQLQPKTYVLPKAKGKVLRASPYYLFVGTVQPRKNLERVILAFSKFISQGTSRYGKSIKYHVSSIKGEKQKKANSHDPLYTIHNTDLVIAGSKGWLSDGIYKLPKKLGIEDRVKFLGYVSDKNLPALYSGAIALVFPSLFEGFGLPILEAQACGTPVITSNISSMPEVAGKGAIYVDPYDVNDIVKGMERLQVTVNRLQLIKRAFENINRFSWEKCAEETLKVLEEV